MKCILNNKNISLFKNNNKIFMINNKAMVDTDTLNLTSKEVPWLSFYYFNPIFNINEDILLPYYVTDFEHSDYISDDNSKSFTIVTNLNGVEKTEIVKIGDNTLNLGRITYESDTYFTIKAIDNNTRIESYVQTIPIWIQDPANHTVNDANTYIMTENDLSLYSINADDSKDAANLISTRKGLSQLFSDKASSGYKKIVLLENRIFRMDYSNVSNDGTPVTIPSNFIVDMNGSTFRINPQSATDSYGNTIVTNAGNSNTVLENGILQGSYKYVGAEDGDDWDTCPSTNSNGQNNLESAGSFNFSGGKYNTLRNMTIKNIQGYSICANSGKDSKTKYITINSNNSKQCYIKNGEEIENENMTTTELLQIPLDIKEKGFLSANRWNGYEGYVGKDGLEFFHWYNSNQEYIGTLKGHQMRLNVIPEDAYYVRITFFGKGIGDTFMQYRDFPTHINIDNVKSYNTRTCAVTSSDYNFMRVNNCLFDNCGRNITAAWLDLEDGYEYGHNCFITNNEVVNSPSSIDCICNFAHNLVFDGNKNMSIEFRRGVKGGVIKNNNIVKALILRKGSDYYNKFGRIFNNTITGGTVELSNYSATEGELYNFKRILKNNNYSQLNINGCDLDYFMGGNAVNVSFKSGNYSKFNITNTSDGNTRISGDYDVNICDSTFTDVSIGVSGAISNKIIRNSKFIGNTTYGDHFDVKFIDCDFDNLNLFINHNTGHSTMNDSDADFEHCTINVTSGSLIQIVGHYAIFKDCIINDLTDNPLVYIYTARNTSDSYTLFDNCTINKNTGYYIKSFYGQSYITDTHVYTIKFKNTNFDESLKNNNYNNDTFIYESITNL